MGLRLHNVVQENAEFQKVIAEQRQTQKLLKEAFRAAEDVVGFTSFCDRAFW